MKGFLPPLQHARVFKIFLFPNKNSFSNLSKIKQITTHGNTPPGLTSLPFRFVCLAPEEALYKFIHLHALDMYQSVGAQIHFFWEICFSQFHPGEFPEQVPFPLV